jgi:AcrR family transcriptional regulator
MSRPRLSRESWVEGAISLVAEGGIAAVAVEPLAARLGATKGSFYWHFTNRDDLIQAVLDAWVDKHTEAIIRHAEAEPDPRARLHRLFVDVEVARRDSRIEVKLLASKDDPRVDKVLQQVTRRRIEYVAQCYRDLGLDDEAAANWALLAYVSRIGLIHAQHATDDGVLPEDRRPSYLAFLEDVMMPPES